MRPRRLLRFENAGGDLTVTFPTNMMEWESQQGLRTALADVVGADYAVDLLGARPASKEPAEEQLRALVVADAAAALDARLDDLRAKLLRIGLGRLVSVDDLGNERWAWARLRAMPDMTLGIGHFQHAPFAASFLRASDWKADSQTLVTQAVSASPTLWTVTNDGTAAVRDAVVRFRANGAGGFVDPKLTNLTSGESFQSTRDAAGATDELRVDCGRFAVEYSTNDGISYASDYGLFSVGTTQVAFMTLQPGANTLQYTGGGTPDLVVEVAFYAAWH